MCIRLFLSFFLVASTLSSCSVMFRGMKDIERYEDNGWYIHPVRNRLRERRQADRKTWDSSLSTLDQEAE